MCCHTHSLSAVVTKEDAGGEWDALVDVVGGLLQLSSQHDQGGQVSLPLLVNAGLSPEDARAAQAASVEKMIISILGTRTASAPSRSLLILRLRTLVTRFLLAT